MSFPELESAPIARLTDVETLIRDGGDSRMYLLFEGSDTGGAMNVTRGVQAANSKGAFPHFHKRMSELLYVYSGALEVLAADRVVTLHAGDAVVVPALMHHAFAPAGGPADVLIVTAPGIDRFEYFRQLGTLTGPPSLELQTQFDNYSIDSPAWSARV